jgi:hypothetical protein
MNSELAKSYIATKDLAKALTFATRSYDASKSSGKDPQPKLIRLMRSSMPVCLSSRSIAILEK